MSGSESTSVPVPSPAAAGGALRRRPTMLDIAKEAGVARSTVSAILSNSGYCYASQHTREVVMAAAKRLGYEPNYLARGLAGQKTFCIGLILESIKGPIVHARKIAAVEQAAWERGYRLLVGSHNSDSSRFTAHLRSFLNQRVDGLIVHHAVGEVESELKRAQAEGVPVVSIDSAGPSTVPDVSFDREGAGYLQVKHLLDLGRRKLVFLVGGGKHPYEAAKVRGHERALREAGIDPQSMCWVFGEPGLAADSPVSGAMLMQKAIASGVDFDAVVTTADMLAMGAMRVVLSGKRRVPGDVAMVGFNNEAISEATDVPLTTIEQTSIATGTKAFEMLLGMIEGKPGSMVNPPGNVLVAGKLIVRGSTVGDAG